MGSHGHKLCSYEFGFHIWLSILQKHLNHFAQVRMKFVQRLALGMCPRKARNISNQKPRIGTLFNDRRK